jgi:hypothetical protein
MKNTVKRSGKPQRAKTPSEKKRDFGKMAFKGTPANKKYGAKKR